MDIFNYSNDIEPLILKMKDEQSKPFHTSLKDFQTLFAEQKAIKLYTETIIPIYQTLEILHTENKIDTEEYNKRILSLLMLLQLVEDIIIEDNHYNFIAIIQIKDFQKTPLFSKAVKGLLHLENIYPIVVDCSIPLKTVQQLLIDNNVSQLNQLGLIDSVTSHINLINSRNIKLVKSISISFHELTKLVNSLPSLTEHSIRVSDWLFDRSYKYGQRNPQIDT